MPLNTEKIKEEGNNLAKIVRDSFKVVVRVGKAITYPSHAVTSTYKWIIDEYNKDVAYDPSKDDYEYWMNDVSAVAVGVAALVLTATGAFAYYKLHQAGFEEALAVPIATNLVDLGYNLKKRYWKQELVE